MPVPAPTVDELIALFNRSSLPVVAVEGKTDAELLRHLEVWIGIDGAIVSCGGNCSVFNLLDRISEIKNPHIAFLADQDICCVKGGHRRHPRLVYTWGYSIENDVIAGSKIDKLVKPAEKQTFGKIRWLVAKYFSYEYEQASLQGRSPEWDTSLQQIVDINKETYRSTVRHADKVQAHDTPFCRKLHKNIKKLLRGKQLVQLYMLILNRPGRSARFSTAALLDSCATLGQNHRLRSLAHSIRNSLGLL